MQINGGGNDMFAAWADSGALVMGRFDAGQSRLNALARQYVLTDNFFQGAFGGGFLNHQYLICACAPEYGIASAESRPSRISVVQRNARGIPQLSASPSSSVSALDGPPFFVLDGTFAPEDYFGKGTGYRAVNTMQPPYQPSGARPSRRDDTLLYADPADVSRLAPQTQTNIGDLLDERNVTWSWYAGGWRVASAAIGKGTISAYDPTNVNFQAHLQPFNYFASLSPEVNVKARQVHLKDYDDFLRDTKQGTLPQVVFYKPEAKWSQHPGYTNIAAGDSHVADLIGELQRSPQWSHMVIIVTWAEFGGHWDHRAPPTADPLGPGTRVPTMVVSPFARRAFVDHTLYDSGSMLRFITRVFHLRELQGLADRDRKLREQGSEPMGDLTNTLAGPLVEDDSSGSPSAAPVRTGADPTVPDNGRSPSAPPNQGPRLWVYLGTYADGKWVTKNLDFPDAFNPSRFDPKTDPNGGIYQVLVSQLNLRYGEFGENAAFPPIQSVLNAGTSVSLQSTAEWFNQNQWWATISLSAPTRAVPGVSAIRPLLDLRAKSADRISR
jgi:acid phosphatase